MIPPASWSAHFSYNHFSQVCARALRNALKEQPRLAAEKRGVTMLRYQKWEGGKGGNQVFLNPPAEK
ncbi:hypothetical protein M408DRAFT_14894 [Serendipita vermifera MAFF 305830]|uniref:Mitochondrial ATP synthase epsilon chain domain-containing protein n=1 Tax=Serendipita vermifera MAFF 305830 TaxID=933852 RepID=A0A0C3B4K2_SERVB|nr:hypothetical protein M408DRAFT_14894 [Serendipita vermifera MAFF 305830]